MTPKSWEKGDRKNGRRFMHLILAHSGNVALVQSMSMDILGLVGKNFYEMEVRQ